FPDGPPRTRAGEFPVRFFQEKLGVVFLQGRTPAGMVDDDVNEHARTERVRGMGKFAKLVDAGGAFIELHKRGVNCCQVERGIRTAKTAETRVSRRCRMDRQQMKNAAAEFVDDMRQLSGEVAKFSRRRKRGIAQ